MSLKFIAIDTLVNNVMLVSLILSHHHLIGDLRCLQHRLRQILNIHLLSIEDLRLNQLRIVLHSESWAHRLESILVKRLNLRSCDELVHLRHILKDQRSWRHASIVKVKSIVLNLQNLWVHLILHRQLLNIRGCQSRLRV